MLPELSHTAILRMEEGKSFQSFLVDSTSLEPKGSLFQIAMKFSGLQLLPNCIRMVDKLRVTFVTSIRDDCTFEFKNFWPEKWSLQMIGYDPFLGSFMSRLIGGSLTGGALRDPRLMVDVPSG